MKRIPSALFLFLSGLLIFTSCKHSTSPNGGGGGFSTVITATVNGRTWGGIIPGSGTQSGYLDAFAGDSNSTITIYYTQSDTGTFTVNGNTGSGLFMTYDTGAGVHSNMYISYANSGSLHFTTNTTSKLAGTFNFKAINQNSPFDTAVITNGTFNMPR